MPRRAKTTATTKPTWTPFRHRTRGRPTTKSERERLGVEEISGLTRRQRLFLPAHLKEAIMGSRRGLKGHY